MFERFEFYGAPDMDREMRLTEVTLKSKDIDWSKMNDTALKSYHQKALAALKKKADPKKPVWRAILQRKKVNIEKEMKKRGIQEDDELDLRAEIERLESTSSPFPEVRERRIQEAREELEQLLELAENYSQMTLAELARVIRRTWKKVNYAAKPYLDAMATLDEMDPHKAKYMMDSGSSIVAYFLSNASSFRGPEAKAIKAELKKRLKRK